MTKLEILKEITAIIDSFRDIDIYDADSVIRDLYKLRERIHEEEETCA